MSSAGSCSGVGWYSQTIARIFRSNRSGAVNRMSYSPPSQSIFNRSHELVLVSSKSCSSVSILTLGPRPTPTGTTRTRVENARSSSMAAKPEADPIAASTGVTRSDKSFRRRLSTRNGNTSGFGSTATIFARGDWRAAQIVNAPTVAPMSTIEVCSDQAI